MTAKEKVLKVHTNAKCITTRISKTSYDHYITDGLRAISHVQSRESWAWAEAVRILKGENKL